MKKSAKRQEEKGSAWMGVTGALVKGSAAALCLTLLLLLGCAAAVSVQWLGQQAMDRCVVMSCIAGALVGAAISMRNAREWAMPLGLGTGMALFLLLLSMGILLYENSPVLDSVPGVFCACLCGGAMAGILGRKTKKTRRR